MKGFYVPASISSSYVSNKRDENGSLIYESAAAQIGMEAQAAFQQLEKNYATTISNAYSSYLASNRNIMGSQMGQGYKELYQQLQQQNLQQNMLSAAVTKQESEQSLLEQEQSALSSLTSAFETEVANFDRVQSLFSQYFDYAKDLTANGQSYLTDEEKNTAIELMYDRLFGIQPYGEDNQYLDSEGNAGKSYTEWVASQLSDSDKDKAFYQWFFSGGLNEFMGAPKESIYDEYTKESLKEQEANKAELTELQKELNQYDWYSQADRLNQQSLTEKYGFKDTDDAKAAMEELMKYSKNSFKIEHTGMKNYYLNSVFKQINNDTKLTETQKKRYKKAIELIYANNAVLHPLGNKK